MQKKHTHGFTMVELMVVLIIVTILAAIAFPSYQESILKTKRAEGRAALMRTMQQQERYYSLHSSYIAFNVASTEADAKLFRWYSGDNAINSFYEISATACDGQEIRDCVILIAAPGTQNVNRNYRDPACGRLTLTSEGSLVFCWQSAYQVFNP
jgi:type IV pilus assembly protein PilE